MKFFDYTEAERKEWRDSDITQAYLALLEERLSECRGNTIDMMWSGDTHRATTLAGQVRGYEQSIAIANEVTK